MEKINPRSLRLGNLFRSNLGDLLKVDLLEEDGVSFYVIDRTRFPLPEGWYAEPIPLPTGRYFVCGVEVHVFVGGSVCIYRQNDLSLIKHDIYLHDLQNLIFALTGQEMDCIEILGKVGGSDA